MQVQATLFVSYFRACYLSLICCRGCQQLFTSSEVSSFAYSFWFLFTFSSLLRKLGIFRCPSYILLTVALFRLLKFERYSRGFKILYMVLMRSQGILAVGGMAAACCLVFSSALMYYAERNNPDPNMSKYYSSVPRAMWVTLLNLSGEAPLCDYTLVGRFVA